jgi:hypothetical protein
MLKRTKLWADPYSNMSGVRLYSYREGDRSECLAQFFLSALGLCASIPRQEDIGFDFLCSIADQEGGILTFGYPYLISIKSRSDPCIRIKPTKSAIKRNKFQHLAWLFRQEQTIFLGVVDKDAMCLSIFSLLPVWFLYYNDGEQIGSLSLNPRFDPKDASDVGPPRRGKELKIWPAHYHYEVDLGHPVAIIDFPKIQNEDRLRATKKLLRLAVELGERNLVHSRLMIPHFYWCAKTLPDASAIQPAFYYNPVPPGEVARKTILNGLAPSLISFALHFKNNGDSTSLQACVRLLSQVPPDTIPPVIRERIPELGLSS